MPERIVFFTEQFFDRLGALLPEGRGADGTPSVTDFLMLDLPRARDRLAEDFEANTAPTDDDDVRVYIGAGVLLPVIALFAVADGQTVEVFWVSVEGVAEPWEQGEQ